MNKMCTFLIIACVGATVFFIAAQITHKRRIPNRSMTFRELMQDNERSATNIWCETGGTK